MNKKINKTLLVIILLLLVGIGLYAYFAKSKKDAQLFTGIDDTQDASLYLGGTAFCPPCPQCPDCVLPNQPCPQCPRVNCARDCPIQPRPLPRPQPQPQPRPQPLPRPQPRPRPQPLPRPRPQPLPRPLPLQQPRPLPQSQPRPQPQFCKCNSRQVKLIRDANGNSKCIILGDDNCVDQNGKKCGKCKVDLVHEEVGRPAGPLNRCKIDEKCSPLIGDFIGQMPNF